jgi:hypothetical protein
VIVLGNKEWNREEVQILRDYWLKESDTELMKRLPRRSKIAINRKRQSMGLMNQPLIKLLKIQERLRSQTHAIS